MEHSEGEVCDSGSSYPICKCGSKTVIKTASTSKNYGKRFYACVNYLNEQNRGCNYFKWVEPEICVCGDRVMSMLMEWQNELKSERAMEIFKCKLELAEYKSKIEVDAANFEIKLQRVETEYRWMQLKFRVALASFWCLVVVLMCFRFSNGLATRLMLSS
ncbi:uncharacterized protein LOC132181974 [Corylus avellana]|uniref:uncharacterized protein LOC132181974 n=1 Tax=Corylus avellana TaxID=13451 RepID=UPI00286C04E6|nr:uncharacterized protein LOC132181974 [Corylus avellana]